MMAKFELYKDTKGEFRWRLKASNGEVIADCNEGYKSKESCTHGMELVKRDAATAPVEDQTAV
ncbi:MAG: YegP family protein [Cytophagales bacterium]|nr:YegP family protein [Armatimonadota bacterium]